MKSFATDTLWDILLELRAVLRTMDSFKESIIIEIRDKKFRIIEGNPNECPSDNYTIIISKNKPRVETKNMAYYSISDQFMPCLEYDRLLDKAGSDFFNMYLPYCFYVLLAKELKRCVTVLHFAQTLDGKIATNAGNSKWIGNSEDLQHSHRMRAICDGVLIGSNTLKCDKPALTVRYVKGPNPAKIVIGNSQHELESLIHNNGKVLLFTSCVNGSTKNIERINLIGTEGHIDPVMILQELFKRGICSVYIEGGAKTASAFLEYKSLDDIQLFLAPRIFGSGVSNFLLPEISEIKDAVSFSNSIFQPMGDGILFSGKVNYNTFKL